MSTTRSTEPLIVERSYNAPVAKVWAALTNLEQIRQWYFDLAEFKAEVGFKFEFVAGESAGCEEGYLHKCEITEVIPNKKLAYSWRYDGYEGDSEVSFEIFEEGGGSLVRITHVGLETFPDTPMFAKSNFNGGWTHFIGALQDFVEKG